MNLESIVMILSISEITKLIKISIESQFYDLKIKGEVSNLVNHSSGHKYFTLKDKDASLNAIIWRGIKSDTVVESGKEVLCTGYVSTYSARSQYQFIIQKVSSYSDGVIKKMIEERMLKLRRLGLFDVERKKRLPKYPKNIAIITSMTGAVIHDIINRLSARFPCNLFIMPTIMQGNDAVHSVVRNLDIVRKMQETKIDVIIIARGGGSQEDLMPFNEESIVHAVANSCIPIVSAIGHETDKTLLDYTSDLYAATPTAAAELVVPDINMVIMILNDHKRLIAEKLNDYFIQQERVVQHCIDNIKEKVNKLSEDMHICYNNVVKIHNLLDRRLYTLKSHVDNVYQNIKSSVAVLLAGKTNILKVPSDNLQSVLRYEYRHLIYIKNIVYNQMYMYIKYQEKMLSLYEVIIKITGVYINKQIR